MILKDKLVLNELESIKKQIGEVSKLKTENSNLKTKLDQSLAMLQQYKSSTDDSIKEIERLENENNELRLRKWWKLWK
jgi:predicted RNase H-like nuclease (RuvC/YqgF family)